MSLHQTGRQLARTARTKRLTQQYQSLTDLYTSFSKLCVCHTRNYHASQMCLASSFDLTTKSTVKDVKELKERVMAPEQQQERTAEHRAGDVTRTDERRGAVVAKRTQAPTADSAEKHMTPEQRRELAVERVRFKQKEDEKKAAAQSQILGSLAPNSLFAEELQRPEKHMQPGEDQTPEGQENQFSGRNFANMAVAINPRPNARARWQRRMVIRDVQHRGRITKAMHIARTERSHLSRSHFFKTSMKKLAPLARQIAGKSIDEAITQMRFSKKKAAIDVKEHLITARNEAIVARGMGLPLTSTKKTATTSSEVTDDPSITPPLPTQRPDRTLRRVHEASRNQTDIYIAQAWTNRGPYGVDYDYRAKGQVNKMRPPYTGLSLLLKEEKTRTREKEEKEAKAIRKRSGKDMWTQLPDRPIVRQSQQVLW